MTLGPRALAVILLAALAAAVPVRPAAQAIQRSLYVSALDKARRPVADLGPTDVIVREDDIVREVLRVTPADEPLQVALMVDNSQFADRYIGEYRQALPAFITALAETARPDIRHQVAVIALGERPTILADYSADRAELLKGVQRIFSIAGSGTYLLDGIIEVSRGITTRGFLRPVMVAITTEGPELSGRYYEAVLEPLRASGAALYVLVLGAASNQSHDRSYVLSVGPKETGGYYEHLLAGNALTGRLKQLAAELTSQYRVTYARPQTLIPPERVTVTAARPGLTVRGRPVNDQDRQGRP